MRGLRGVDNFPAVLFKQIALIIRQAALRIVQDQARPDRRERRIDVDRIGIARKIHGVDAVIGEMSAQPFDPFEVRGETVLYHQVLTEPQHIGGIKQGLFLGGDEKLFRGPFQALCLADFFGQIIRVVIGIRQSGLGRGFVAKLGSSSK